MSCTRVRIMLLEAAEGELPEAQRAVLDRHLEDCSDCRAELERLRKASGSLRKAVKQIDPPTAYLTPRRRDRLFEAYRRKTKPVRLITFRRVVAAAAVAAIIACSPFILSDLQGLLAPPARPLPVADSGAPADYAVLTSTGAEGPVRPVRLLPAGMPRPQRAQRPVSGELVRTDAEGLSVPARHALYDPEESSRWW